MSIDFNVFGWWVSDLHLVKLARNDSGQVVMIFYGKDVNRNNQTFRAFELHGKDISLYGFEIIRMMERDKKDV